MANYAGVAGTRQLTDKIGDELMQMAKKWFKTVSEESGQAASLEVEGGFELNGEAALDKEKGLGVAVRASSPNLGPQIPVEISTDVGYDSKTHGTVRANIGYYFKARLTADNHQLATIRREQLLEDGEEAPEVSPVRNNLGR